ncbi:SDR family NAD(P)-dependent oxidoreductase [Sphingopyxis sp. Root1497]|uniref:SDR family NAD(P)-dependent oxidoreductase n=1 Tax=Sphingopyxis sp. Root1497 TaxID=1736474 RepID=UPI000B2605D6|nr:SDR family NAD(P)-dependent oxidoreductase [Sphingopyxis sp. Root1497]
MTQSILIIGAGPGIGQTVARKFGKQGWQIILAARSRTNLDDLVADLADSNISAQALVVDAADPAALRAAIAEADQMTGGLSAVHFNAAVVRQQDLFSMSDDEVISDLAVNVAAGLHSIRAAAAQFGTRGGTILVTGGGLAIAPHESYASLGIGKAALRNGVQALVDPLASKGIRIAMVTVSTLVAPRSIEAEEVANHFWDLATNEAPAWEVVYPDTNPAQSELTLIAKLTAKAEYADLLGEELSKLVAPTLAEAGSIAYRIHRDNDNPSIWILYENWRSRADLDAHFEQPYTKAMMDRFPELLARDIELTFASKASLPR